MLLVHEHFPHPAFFGQFSGAVTTCDSCDVPMALQLGNAKASTAQLGTELKVIPVSAGNCLNVILLVFIQCGDVNLK